MLTRCKNDKTVDPVQTSILCCLFYCFVVSVLLFSFFCVFMLTWLHELYYRRLLSAPGEHCRAAHIVKIIVIVIVAEINCIINRRL